MVCLVINQNSGQELSKDESPVIFDVVNGVPTLDDSNLTLVAVTLYLSVYSPIGLLHITTSFL